MIYGGSVRIKSIEPLLYSSKKTILGGDFNQTYRTNSHLYNLPEFTVHNIDCPTYYIEQKLLSLHSPK